MEARVGTLAVGTRITTLLTGRSGVVRELGGDRFQVAVEFDNGDWKTLHPDVRVRVVEVTH